MPRLIVPFSREDAQRAWQLLVNSAGVLIATHANPDADAVASTLALHMVLRQHGVQTIPTIGDGRLPPELAFLPDSSQLVMLSPTEGSAPPADCIALVDCADPSRLGPLSRAAPQWFDGRVPLINIDHHVTNTRFGLVNLVDPAAAATTEVLAEWLILLEEPITPPLATCLLSGIYGDTLSLQTSSTRPQTLRLVATLLERGADLERVVAALFRSKPYSTVRLWGLALSRAQLRPPIIWTEITPDMLAESGATPAEGEGIVNFLLGVDQTLVAVMFYQQPENWRVSLRSASEQVDVATIAAQFGGGGHSRAAGCRLPPGPAARDAFLEAVAAAVADQLQHGGSPYVVAERPADP